MPRRLRMRPTPAKDRLLKAMREAGYAPARAHPERDLHEAVERFLSRAWPADLPYTHVPNGELRARSVAARLKRMGVKPGWPDFIFILPGAVLHALELKASKGSMSPHQVAFRDALLAQGGQYAVARTLEDVELILTAWLAPHGRRLRASILETR